MRSLVVLVASMVSTVQVGEHLLLANDWPVSLLGHQVLALVVLFGNLFVAFLAMESFTVFLDNGSDCCNEQKEKYSVRMEEKD